MHAWLCETTTGPQDLVWRELPTPEPAADEVRIKIRAASINFPDLLTVVGKYQIRPELPFVPGSEFAGTVDAVGSAVTRLKPGMPVAAIGSSGGFGTHACVKAANAIPLPPGFKLEDAAAFAFTYGTSYHALLDRGQLQAGETVLVLGAAGGVGTAAVQIAKAAGAKVIAAASTDDKCAACLSIGADAAINYSTQSLRDELKTLTGGRGPDIVYDPVGGDLAEPAFRAIAWRGRYLVVGFAAGGIPALPFNLPLLKGASVVGVFWGDHVRREPAANAKALGELARWYGEGKIKPVIDTLLPMSELATAYRRMAAREIKGKLVMVNAD